jgi:hypothetical protein
MADRKYTVHLEIHSQQVKTLLDLRTFNVRVKLLQQLFSRVSSQ